MADTELFPSRPDNSRTRRLVNWAAVLLWAGIIFNLSSVSDFGMKTTPKSLSVLAHAFEFGVLTILLIRALRGERYAVPRAVWMAALLALIYAGSDEYHQSFVANRHPSVFDLLIDAAAIGAVAIVALTREQPRPS